MGWWQRLTARISGPEQRAREAEARGDLEAATAAWLEAERPEEAARLYVLRADAAAGARERLQLLGQAVAVARGDALRAIELKRCRLRLDLARSGAMQLAKSELVDLGEQLERADAPLDAAEAYALAGDEEARARALVSAGAVNELERVLDAQRQRERAEQRRERRVRELRDADSAGRRREALELARDAVEDERLRELVAEIEARRVLGPTVALLVRGESRVFAFGEELIVGRADAPVVVASPVVSRAHLAIRRGPDGPVAVDLRSSNGTVLGGARIDVPVPVRDGLELLLGGEVPVEIAPDAGGVRLRVAGRVVHAPLGPLRIDDWWLEPGADGWLELRSEGPAPVLGKLRGSRRMQLCRGDVLRAVHDGEVLLEVPG